MELYSTNLTDTSLHKRFNLVRASNVHDTDSVVNTNPSRDLTNNSSNAIRQTNIFHRGHPTLGSSPQQRWQGVGRWLPSRWQWYPDFNGEQPSGYPLEVVEAGGMLCSLSAPDPIS